MKFKDKVVLVTGSSRGIGKAIAVAFAKEGAKVVINYSVSKKEAEAVAKEINSIAIQCDVSKELQVKKMFEFILKRFKRLDILVNNAGGYIDGDEWFGSSKIWEKTLQINLLSVLNTSKYAAKIFQKQKSGNIINIASTHAISGRDDAIAYAASKAGVVNVTQAYAKMLAPYARVNAVSPSTTNCGYWLRAPKEELKEKLDSMPMKRLIAPEEIAHAVLFLASDQSAMTIGQNIIVSGGKHY